jgi:hypothetical protein
MVAGTRHLEDAWGQSLQASGHLDAAIAQFTAAQQRSSHPKTAESRARTTTAKDAVAAAIALLRTSAHAIADYVREVAPDLADTMPNNNPEAPPVGEELTQADHQIS